MSKKLAAGLARRLAAHRVSDGIVRELAAEIDQIGFSPVDVDICQYGICIDYWVEGRDKVQELIDQLGLGRRTGGIKIFPKGILDPDRFLVTVEHVVGR